MKKKYVGPIGVEKILRIFRDKANGKQDIMNEILEDEVQSMWNSLDKNNMYKDSSKLIDLVLDNTSLVDQYVSNPDFEGFNLYLGETSDGEYFPFNYIIDKSEMMSPPSGTEEGEEEVDNTPYNDRIDIEEGNVVDPSEADGNISGTTEGSTEDSDESGGYEAAIYVYRIGKERGVLHLNSDSINLEMMINTDETKNYRFLKIAYKNSDFIVDIVDLANSPSDHVVEIVNDNENKVEYTVYKFYINSPM